MGKMTAIVLATILGGPLMPKNCEVQTVDVIEVNHVYCKDGRLMFSQVVLWRIEASDGKLHNWGWKLIRVPWDQPVKVGAKWELWHTCGRGRLEIHAPCYRERSTNEDVERLDTKEFWGGSAPNLFLMEKEKVGNE
jgi:hypothetical protein